jgi:putative transposase
MRDVDFWKARNAAYQTADHAVWIPKYRKRVVSGAVADRLRGLLSDVAHGKAFEVRALEIQPDPVHLFFPAPPAIAPSLAIQWFKGITARSPVAEFPPVRRVLRRGHLWAPSFSGGTAGRVSAATIRRSIERAEHLRTRR